MRTHLMHKLLMTGLRNQYQRAFELILTAWIKKKGIIKLVSSLYLLKRFFALMAVAKYYNFSMAANSLSTFSGLVPQLVQKRTAVCSSSIFCQIENKKSPFNCSI